MASGHQPRARDGESGMMLLEALVALAIVAMVTISYLGIRTTALMDATHARNWRLAREIAEERLTELQAGAREVPPESGVLVLIDKYEGFSFKIVLGESAVAELESEVAQASAGDDEIANDRVDWQRNRENYRRASQRGLSAMEYDDQLHEDINQRLAAKAPSADDIEEVAVVVYFPKLDPDFEGQQETLLIKSRVSTLAISGMTPEQAQSMAQAKGEGSSDADSAGSNPLGGSQPPAGSGR